LPRFSVSAAARAASLECIAPSKPGGAMDLTCKLAQKGLQGLRSTPNPPPSDMHISYLPGGIGAVAWHSLVSQRRAEPNTLVAFSGGSLLNLAQGKFGKAKSSDVRWVAALGADYGMIAVRADSPYKTLGELVAALKSHPQKVLIGVSGTIGSQDWLKMALVVRTAGVDPKVLRFVALEGGGEPSPRCTRISCRWCPATPARRRCTPAVTLACWRCCRSIACRACWPMCRRRREQGIDVVWPIIRGVWMGPQVSDADYQHWVSAFDRVLASPQFVRMRANRACSLSA
jgi:putative tricarboxylic transport membrane protein